MKNGFEGLLGGAAKNEELKNFVDELNTALERNPQSVLLQAIAALLKEDDQKMIDYEFNSS